MTERPFQEHSFNFNITLHQCISQNHIFHIIKNVITLKLMGEAYPQSYKCFLDFRIFISTLTLNIKQECYQKRQLKTILELHLLSLFGNCFHYQYIKEDAWNHVLVGFSIPLRTLKLLHFSTFNEMLHGNCLVF